MEDINKSLISAIKALKNTLSKLFNEYPIFLYTILFLVYNFLSCIKLHGNIMVIFLCGLFLIISFALYFHRKNFTETFLSFLLGALTIFNVNWTYKTSMIFTIFTLSFIGLIFMGSCIRLAAKEESILTHAAYFLGMYNFDENYAQLKLLARKDTKFKQLGKERAKIIQFLVFHKIPLQQIEECLNEIEKIYLVFQVDTKLACDFFYSVYLVFSNIKKSKKAYSEILDDLMNRIFYLPLHPYETINIFNKTRSILLKNNNLDAYFKTIDGMAKEGYFVEDIINKLKETINV